MDIKDSTELEQSEGESLHSSPAVTEQNQLEENPVMNFFKTLVSTLMLLNLNNMNSFIMLNFVV